MNKEALKEFLLYISQKGYGDTEGEDKWVKEDDGSTTIVLESEDKLWKMHDNFFGGEPYGGREVIFYEGKPVWIMVYYGQVNSNIENLGDVYSFLQNALRNPDQEAPLRGPRELVVDNMRYVNTWNGDLFKFNGSEQILRDGEEVYTASYLGGLIDQRGENT